MGLDGSVYVMAGHQVSVYTHWHLYRDNNGVVTRTAAPLPSIGCPDIAYDLALDEVHDALMSANAESITTIILDVIHALESLWKASDAFFSEASVRPRSRASAG